MTDHSQSAVIERVITGGAGASVSNEKWPGDFSDDDQRLIREGMLRSLATLQPGDQLPGGNVVAQGWHEIASAPKDGTEIDLWWSCDGEEYRVADCEYRDEHSWLDIGGNTISAQFITHWRLKPEPPHDQ